MNDLFDELVMDEEKKDMMRDTLRQTKAARKTPLIVMAAVAAAIALVMVIPFTRTAVVSAAEKLIAQFTTHNGTKVSIVENKTENYHETKVDFEAGDGGGVNFDYAEMINGEDKNYVAINRSEPGEDDYGQLIDGRIYFVFEGEKTDITDQISYNDYFRYEFKNANGSREVIFIGGTPDNFGWCSFCFDEKETTVFREGNIPWGIDDDARPEWYKKACHSEHVYCGEADCEYSPDSYSVDLKVKDN